MAVIVNNPGGGDGNATYQVTSTTTTPPDVMSIHSISTTAIHPELSTTDDKMQCITVNMTQGRALMEKLLSKNCK